MYLSFMEVWTFMNVTMINMLSFIKILDSSNESNDSKLKNGAEQTNMPYKLSLQTRLFSTVPYLGKGPYKPGDESELIHSEYVNNTKTVNNTTEQQHNVYVPLIPEMKQTVANPNNLVQENARSDWVRGGVPTRDAFKNKKYN